MNKDDLVSLHIGCTTGVGYRAGTLDLNNDTVAIYRPNLGITEDTVWTDREALEKKGWTFRIDTSVLPTGSWVQAKLMYNNSAADALVNLKTGVVYFVENAFRALGSAKMLEEEGYVFSYPARETPVTKLDTPDKPTGGPSSYYDLFDGVRIDTSNDIIELLATKVWLAHACHFKDIFKACVRWGGKDGTSKGYDARKIVYSGLRLLLMVEGRGAVAKYLKELAADKQFKA